MTPLTPRTTGTARQDGEHPPCFGEHEQVCPRDESGVMQPQGRCLTCPDLRPCLQQALKQQGLIGEPFVEAPIVSKVTHFFKRWSDQKLARNRQEDRKEMRSPKARG